MFPHTRRVCPASVGFARQLLTDPPLSSPPPSGLRSFTLGQLTAQDGQGQLAQPEASTVPGLPAAPHRCSSLPCRLILPNSSWQRGPRSFRREIDSCLFGNHPALFGCRPPPMDVGAKSGQQKQRPPQPTAQAPSRSALGLPLPLPSSHPPPLVGTGQS